MTTYKPWTRLEELRLKQMAEDGLPAVVIANELGRSKNSVYDRAQKLNVRLQYPCGTHHGRTRLPDEVIKAIRVMNEGGVCAAAITRLLNRQHRIGPSYVQYVCNGERRQEVA